MQRIDAGHDRFGPDLIERELGWLRSGLSVDSQRFLGLARTSPADGGERYCLTVLALKASRYRNGVSSLHGHTTRRMWHKVWPARAEEEVPIGHVTNGVHVPSWLAQPMRQLYDRYLERPKNVFFWAEPIED